MDLDLNIIIPAAMAMVSGVAIAAINRKRDSPIVKNEPAETDHEKDRVITALSKALMHCLQEHGA